MAKKAAKKKSPSKTRSPLPRSKASRAPFEAKTEPPGSEIQAVQATWGGRFGQGPAALMLRFSESISFDARLAPYDVFGSKAHAAMLCHVGIISAQERDAIQKGLNAVLIEIEEGTFTWNIACEDVHMNIEQALLEKTPAAAKLHTARSRNDQVATDMRLFFKKACCDLYGALNGVLEALVNKATVTVDRIIPGYTHLQRAQPVSFAHHLLAYAEMFGRDRDRFATVSDHANWCPLGAGALAGTTLDIDREFTARYLGFVDAEGSARVTQNSMDTVADRDLYIEFATACALVGSHFSRLAEDFILWNSAEFNLLRLPEAFTTGSSLMPQKKNPDSLELLRGKAARLQGHVQTLYSLVKGLPLNYNRDLQEDKIPVFDAYDQTLISLQVLAEVIAGCSVNEKICTAVTRDPWLLATDLVDYLVRKGVPFREAHHIIGRLVALAESEGVPLDGLMHSQVQAIDERFDAEWIRIFNLDAALARRDGIGMPSPVQVNAQIERWRERLKAPGPSEPKQGD